MPGWFPAEITIRLQVKPKPSAAINCGADYQKVSSGRSQKGYWALCPSCGAALHFSARAKAANHRAPSDAGDPCKSNSEADNLRTARYRSPVRNVLAYLQTSHGSTIDFQGHGPANSFGTRPNRKCLCQRSCLHRRNPDIHRILRAYTDQWRNHLNTHA